MPYTQKQRRWACAQTGKSRKKFKGKKMSKKEAEEMCSAPLKKESVNEKTNIFSAFIQPDQYLFLTTDGSQKDEDEIRSRAEMMGDWEQARAGSLSLTVEVPSGKVVDHEGRARAYLANQNNIQYVPVEITFVDEKRNPYNTGAIEKTYDLPIRHLVSQFRGEFDRVSRVNIIPDTKKETDTDPLNVGSQGFTSDVESMEKIIDKGGSRWVRNNKTKNLDDYVDVVNALYSFDPEQTVVKKNVGGIYRIRFQNPEVDQVTIKSINSKIQESVEEYFKSLILKSDIDINIEKTTIKEWLDPEMAAPWDEDYNKRRPVK